MQELAAKSLGPDLLTVSVQVKVVRAVPEVTLQGSLELSHVGFILPETWARGHLGEEVGQPGRRWPLMVPEVRWLLAV